MYNDAHNGFGFNEPFKSNWNVESVPLSKVHQTGVRVGLIPSLLGFMLSLGDDPLVNHFEFQLNLTIPSLVRRYEYAHIRPTDLGVGTKREGTKKAPVRRSWDYAPALWSAAVLCEELLLASQVCDAIIGPSHYSLY